MYAICRASGFLLGLFFISTGLFAQNTADLPTEKSQRDSYLGISLGVILPTDSLHQHQFLVQANAYALPGSGQNGFDLTGIMPVHRLDLQVGYAAQLSPNWRLGANIFLSKKDTEDQLSGELWLSHTSHIRDFLFWEKRVQFRADNTSREGSEARGQFLLRTGLGKRWALGDGHGLTSLLSFTAGLDTHESLGDTRTVDRTEWHLSLLWDRHERFPLALGLWAGRLTEYFFAIETTRYDANGNLIDFRPDRKLNIRRFTYGLRLLFRIGGARAAQPTQLQAMQSLRPR